MALEPSGSDAGADDQTHVLETIQQLQFQGSGRCG